MASASLFAFVALITTVIIQKAISFTRNLRAAKASGITYVIVPVYLYHRFWLVTYKIWLIGIRKLPRPWTHSWIHFLDPDWTWSHRYEPFHRLGTDTILTVSPGGCIMWTVDPSVISQVASRRNDFPKPMALYKSLDVYGKNIITTEGEQWRMHRKITSPPFAEKNNVLVWQETVYQAQKMLGSWLGPDGQGNRTVHWLMNDTLRLSLYVISKAGFGVRMQWPTEGEGKRQDDPAEEDSNDPSKIRNEGYSEGHTMTYTRSLQVVLDKIILVMLVPHWILKNSPFKVMRRAHEAYVEWGKYMGEMIVTKKREIQSGKPTADLLSALVHGAGVSDKDQTPKLPLKGDEQSETVASISQDFTGKEVLGNAFAFILAGHETAGNSMHFILISLALKMQSQRRLQRDIESVLENRPPEEWSYDHDLPKLFGGMTGAVLHEQFRLVPPVTNIPKSVLDEDQNLVIDGKCVTVPARTSIGLISTGAHRNPKYWPHGPPTDSSNPGHPICNLDNDLEEFKPERWLLEGGGKTPGMGNGDAEITKSSITDANSQDPSIHASEDDIPKYTSLFHPPRGAYIPFSDGHRSCLGRRFGQIEILAVLAVIFSRYSVELAVDDFATDQEIDRMTMTERQKVWNQAARRATNLMNNSLTQIITLKMSYNCVPLRFVKKGEEKFDFS